MRGGRMGCQASVADGYSVIGDNFSRLFRWFLGGRFPKPSPENFPQRLFPPFAPQAHKNLNERLCRHG